MSDRRVAPMLVSALIVFCFALSAYADPAQNVGTSPSIPLPVLEPGDIAVPHWNADRQLPHSTLAWHYNPDLVRPLLEVADAVDSDLLDFSMRRMLIAVVASRNNCFY